MYDDVKNIDSIGNPVTKSLYESIGLSPDASQEEIDDLCISLAKKYSSQESSGVVLAKERLAEVETAYEILGDPSRRRQYDSAHATESSLNRAFNFSNPIAMRATMWIGVVLIVLSCGGYWYFQSKEQERTKAVALYQAFMLGVFTNYIGEKITLGEAHELFLKTRGSIAADSRLRDSQKESLFGTANDLELKIKGYPEQLVESLRIYLLKFELCGDFNSLGNLGVTVDGIHICRDGLKEGCDKLQKFGVKEKVSSCIGI